MDPSNVDAAFWFSATNKTLQPTVLPGLEELEALLEKAKEATG